MKLKAKTCNKCKEEGRFRGRDGKVRWCSCRTGKKLKKKHKELMLDLAERFSKSIADNLGKERSEDAEE